MYEQPLTPEELEKGVALFRACHAHEIRYGQDHGWWELRIQIRAFGEAHPQQQYVVLDAWYAEHFERTGIERPGCRGNCGYSIEGLDRQPPPAVVPP